jgi:YD repeat-containing protein
MEKKYTSFEEVMRALESIEAEIKGVRAFLKPNESVFRALDAIRPEVLGFDEAGDSSSSSSTPPPSSSSSSSPCQPLQLIDSFSEATGPRYRKIALNGMPKPDGKPQGKPETDEEREETYVDALNLSLRHDTSDIYIPVVGDALPFAIKRSVTPEVFTTNPSLRAEQAVNRPFGHGWTSMLAASVQFTYKTHPGGGDCPEDQEEPDYTFVTDENGASYRFLNIWEPGTGNPAFLPIPTNLNEQDNFLCQLIVDIPTAHPSTWTYTFTKKHGTVLKFSSPIINQSYLTSPSTAQFYAWSRLLSITDQYGNVIAFNGDTATTPTSLIPSSITISNPNDSSYDRTIAITRSAPDSYGNRLRVISIQDPMLNAPINYLYETFTVRTGDVVTMLVTVERPEGQTIQYTYDTSDYVEDNSYHPSDDPGPFYFTRYNLTSITDANGNMHSFAYQPDASTRNFSSYIGWYTPTSSPKIISQVTLPDGAVSRFMPDASSPVQIEVDDTNTAYLQGQRQIYVYDTEQPVPNIRTYTFTMGQLSDSSAIAELFISPNAGVQTRYYYLIRWQRMQLTHPTGVTETFMFNTAAAMALASVTDYSGNTTSYDYADEWKVTDFIPFLAPYLPNPLFYSAYSDPTSQTDALGYMKSFQYENVPPAPALPTILRIMTQITDELSRVTTYGINPVNGLRTSETIRYPASIIVTGTTTSVGADSTTISDLSSTAGLVVGMSVSGAGIPSGATVTGVSIGSSSVNISVPATEDNAATPIVFVNQAPFTLTGGTSSGSNIISLASVSDIAVGMSVSGAGIPYGTTVTAISSSSLTITLSAAATSTSLAAPIVFAYPATITVFGNTENTSSTISDLSSATGLVVGMNVYGTGIPLGATVASIVSSNSITISMPATATNAGTSLAFSYFGGDVVKTTLFEYTDSNYTAFMTKKTVVGGTTGADLVTTYVSDGYGYVAQETTGGISITGNFLADSPTISVSSTAGLAQGMSVFGVGIPSGATVSSVNVGSSSITILPNTTALGTNTPLTFTYPTAIELTGTTNGTNIISGFTSTAGLEIGMGVIGMGIPSGATISGVGANFVVITLSATTSLTSVPLIFTYPAAIANVLEGSTTSSAPTTISLASTMGLAAGMGVSGTGIPSGATVSSVGSSSVTISVAATVFGSNSFTFTYPIVCTTTKYLHDKNGNRILVADPNNNVTKFAYDELNRLIQVTNADSTTRQITYDPAGNKIAETDENSHVTVYTYDQLNRLIKKQRVMGTTLAMTGNIDGTVNPPTISGLASTAGIATGMAVIGRGIPVGAFVATIATTPPSITLAIPYIEKTGILSNGSIVIKGLANTTGLVVGMSVIDVTDGSDIPSGAKIATLGAPQVVMPGSIRTNNQITNLANTSGLVVGMTVSGTGIPSGATVASIVSATEITISVDSFRSLDDVEFTFTYSAVAITLSVPAAESISALLAFRYPTETLTGVLLTFASLNSAVDLITQYAYNEVNSKISETDPNGYTTSYGYDMIQRLTQITDALGQVWVHDFSGPNTGASAFSSSDFKPTQITDPRGMRTWFVYDALYRTLSKNVEYQVIA